MSFDRIAPHYRWLEFVLAGEKLQRCRTVHLRRVVETHRALLVGEGNGRFLAACARQLPETHFTVLDASAAMLERARKNWERAGGEPVRAAFIQGTLPDCALPEGRFDLIVTNFFFDCFTERELPAIIFALAAAAAPSARWLVSDFAVPPTGLPRWRALLVLKIAYAFFRRATGLSASEIVSPDRFLNAKGFRMKRRIDSDFGLLHADCWER
jgi:ubiquinone/menaquinone biosynthesis C-methylase UbiE